MKPPPFLLAAALLLWGWQTGLLLAAAAMTAVLEGARVVRLRWEMAPADFNRVADLCTLLFLGVIGYQFITGRFPEAMFVILQWLPIILFPLMASQVYSTTDRINLSALFLTLRNRQQDFAKDNSIDLRYPYFGVCLLAAAAANSGHRWFYWALTGLCAWALWGARPKRYGVNLWALCFAAAAVSGSFGQQGLSALQNKVEEAVLEWFADFIRADADPFRSVTRIGQLGALKFNDRIVLRVKPEGTAASRILLRDGTYNAFDSVNWHARAIRFQGGQAEPDGQTWRLGNSHGNADSVTIATSLRNGRGVLVLPQGTFEISRLPALKLEHNGLGAVKVEDAPGFVTYRARFAPGANWDDAPSRMDLEVPRSLDPVLTQVAGTLDIAGKRAAERLQAITKFFADNFQYTLFLGDRDTGAKSIREFLLRSRAGHCEYFATATVLLLRKAGIPARYATGFAAQEYSRREGLYLVRMRHAHSWALAFVDGAWREIDTTPAVWASEEEKQAASVMQPLYDLGSWLMFKFEEWRWSESDSKSRSYWAWAILPLILILLWRIYARKKRVSADTEGAREEMRRSAMGADSAFYQIERHLAAKGFPRRKGETFLMWIKRIESGSGMGVSIPPLHAMLRLHYRYRFDPEGLSDAEKITLEREVRSWLGTHAFT